MDHLKKVLAEINELSTRKEYTVIRCEGEGYYIKHRPKNILLPWVDLTSPWASNIASAHNIIRATLSRLRIHKDIIDLCGEATYIRHFYRSTEVKKIHKELVSTGKNLMQQLAKRGNRMYIEDLTILHVFTFDTYIREDLITVDACNKRVGEIQAIYPRYV